MPIGHHDIRRPNRALHRDFTISRHHEAATVKHQFILPAKLIDINQRQARFAHARMGMGAAFIVFAALKRRPVGRHQKLGTFSFEMRAHITKPDILANRQAQPHAAHFNGCWQGAGMKQAFFVKHRIIRQVMFVPHRHLPAIGGDHAIVQLAALNHGRAENQRWATICREGDEIIDHLAHAREKRALEHKVFGRIAGQKQFAGSDNISPRSGGFTARLLQKFGVARQVADNRV